MFQGASWQSMAVCQPEGFPGDSSCPWVTGLGTC